VVGAVLHHVADVGGDKVGIAVCAQRVQRGRLARCRHYTTLILVVFACVPLRYVLLARATETRYDRAAQPKKAWPRCCGDSAWMPGAAAIDFLVVHPVR